MVSTPVFPEYHIVKHLIKVLNGKHVAIYKRLWNTIWNLTGTPQNPGNWQDPDSWIMERLEGDQKQLALEIWNRTNKIVNPRYLRGPKFLIDGYNLLDFADGIFSITKEGQTFIGSDQNRVVAHIDVEEGCIFLLFLVSIHGKGKRSTFFEEWKDYLLKNSNYRTTGVVNDSLTRRLRNLTKRKLIQRDGNVYATTPAGLSYLEQFDNYQTLASLSEEADLGKEIEKFNNKQKESLKEQLKKMDPFHFERTVGHLLEAMGYEDVEVTSARNDKGVDVVGLMQQGISSIKEVIQVKRNTKGNVQRNVLDALRGSLHRFDALQGTIITTSDFSKGTKEAAFERGAAPITLINGDKLIELLVEYDIGIEKKKTTFFTVDPDYFSSDETESGDETIDQ